MLNNKQSKIVLTGYHIVEPTTYKHYTGGLPSFEDSNKKYPQTFTTVTEAMMFIDNHVALLRDTLRHVTDKRFNELHICNNRTGDTVIVFEV